MKEFRIASKGKWRKMWLDKLSLDSFCQLNYVLICDCERLLSVFPFDMMEKLGELTALRILNCESLEEIVGPAGLHCNESHAINATQSIIISFPKVAFLGLSTLPKLKGFYSKKHTTEWPSLTELQVIRCNEVEIFAAEYRNLGENHDISVQQPLFWFNEV